MSNYEKISSFVWNVADDVLRGTFKPHQYGQIILPFTILRRLDSILEPKKNEVIKLYTQWKNKTDDPTPIILNKVKLKYYNYSNYDIKRLAQDSQNIKKNFKNYLAGFSNNIEDVIENFEIDQHLEKLEENDLLFLLVEKFSSIDLSPSKVSNYEMGLMFEELLRKFSEMSNETSGEHYTPRDVVQLLVSLVFSEDEKKMKNLPVVSIYDCCCGTGGMLTIGRDWLNKNINKKIKTLLFGQELNPETYAICKAEMLITGEDPENIKSQSCISKDKFKDQKFQFMITNPPYGVSWKKEKNFVNNESKNLSGRFSAGTPRVDDGQFLFLQHLISKMDPEGSRVGIVFNSSPLFIGDAEQGESEIRKSIIENDMLETVISLPNQLFFNTGINTYFWIITNNKSKYRKGKIQLINVQDFFTEMKTSLGDKRKEISQEDIRKILDIYLNFKEDKFSKIYDNNFFKFTKITIEQPLIDNGKVKKDKKGNTKSDARKRDYERIFSYENTENRFQKWVKHYYPDAWINESKNKIGYQIPFVKCFYDYSSLRPLDKVVEDLKRVENEFKDLVNKIQND